MALLKFLKGNYAGLSTKAISEGQVLICGDTGEMFVDVAADKRVKIGDFVVMSDIASLEALDATSVPTSRLYYVEDGNILARSNGTKWVQINKQQTLSELGGVSATTYATDKEALVNADAENATATANLKDYVGTFTHDTAKTVVEYINAKTDGIATSGNLEALGTRVTTAEGEIDALQEALAEGGTTETAIANAQAAADAAQGDVNTLAGKVGEVPTDKTVVSLIGDAQKQADKGVEDAATAQAKADEAYNLADGKATMDQVNTAIANAGHAVKSDVDTAIDNLDKAYKAADTTLQGNIDKKVDQDDYDAKVAELAGADTTLQGNIDALAGKVGTPTEGKTVVEMIADAQAEATYDDTQVKADIKANADAIDAIEADYLKNADKDGLQEQITANANAIELLTNGVSAEEVDGVNDLIQYVKDHGTEVTGIKEDIAENAKAISDHAAAAEANYETKTDAAQKLTDANAYTDTEVAKDRERLDALELIDHTHDNKGVLDGITAEKVTAWDAAEQNAKDYADGKIADLKIGDYAKQADLDAHTGDTVVHITADERTAWNAAEQNAKDHADGLNTAMNSRVEALEAVDHEHANKGVLDGITAEKVAAWDAAQANAEDTASKALSAAKTQLEGKITAEANTARAAEKANADAIALLNGEGEGSVKKALADAKAYADTAEADAITSANSYTDSALTWGSF